MTDSLRERARQWRIKHGEFKPNLIGLQEKVWTDELVAKFAASERQPSGDGLCMNCNQPKSQHRVENVDGSGAAIDYFACPHPFHTRWQAFPSSASRQEFEPKLIDNPYGRGTDKHEAWAEGFKYAVHAAARGERQEGRR